MTRAMVTAAMAGTVVMLLLAPILTMATLSIRRHPSTAMGRRHTIRRPATCRPPYCNSITVMAADFDITTDGGLDGAVETMVFMVAEHGGRAGECVAAMAAGAEAAAVTEVGNYRPVELSILATLNRQPCYKSYRSYPFNLAISRL